MANKNELTERPIRTTPFPPYYPGSTVYDEHESAAAAAVIEAQSPFRYYGPNLLGKVEQFERETCRYLGVKKAVAVSSGTAAVIVALKAAGIGAGDKVIVPACTFIATAGAVVCAGAFPVFADIDDSFSINPDKLEEMIDEHTKAIITVPILGNPCEMDKIMEIADRRGLIVIEDAAQSLGATYQGKYVGTFGHINTFSLQMNKLITTGEGGIVVTDDAKLYERAVRYHDQGMFREGEGFLGVSDENDAFIGQNYRMSEITGAVALEQIYKLDDILAKMRRIKAIIKEGTRGIPGVGFRRINDENGDCGNCVIWLLDTPKKAATFHQALVQEGMPIGRLYNAEPIYMQPHLLHQKSPDHSGFPFNTFDIPYNRDMCPDAVSIMARNVQLMIGPKWTEQDANDVVAAVRKVAPRTLA